MASLFAKYNHLLATRPLITNIITTGFLFGAGDVLAQTVELRQAKSSENDILGPSKLFDYPRLSRAVIYGSIIFAPLGDRWYRLLNNVNVSLTKVVNTCARVGLDQLVFAPFIGIPLYFSAMTAMEGGDNVKRDVENKLKANWWDTLTANWTVWPAVQAVNFTFVPVQLRLLTVNAISIVWNCYLLMQLNGEKKDDLYILE